MDDLISRRALLAEYDRQHKGEAGKARTLIEAAPAVDAVEVKHGRWLKTKEPLGWQDVDCVECSCCHESWIFDEEDCFEDMWLWNYCPNCGADMRERKEE